MIEFEEMNYDICQTKLSINGSIPNNSKIAENHIKNIVKGKMLICPFCLNTSYLSQFTTDKNLYKCKYCGNKMQEETLKKIFIMFNQQKIDVEAFAKWVYGYRLNGFFQKIKFEEWNNKLKDLEIGIDFWYYYKRFKGEWENENTSDNEE